jgi:hypothetical protein
LLLLRSISVFFAFSGTRISIMDNKIIKTKLEFVFSVVELPKKWKKSNFNFDPFFHFFGHFPTLRARISGKHYPKVKFFAKFEFSVSDLPKTSKSAKKALLADFDFFILIFRQSDIWFSDHSSEIPHQTGSSGVSFHRAHVGAHQSHLCQIAHVPVKYNLFSKFKFVIFWRFFALDPT